MHKDHDKDPSTPCQANLGLLVGAIMFLTIAGLVSVVTIPLYCRPRNKIIPDVRYLEDEFKSAEKHPKERQREATSSAAGSNSEGEHSGEGSSSEESDEILDQLDR